MSKVEELKTMVNDWFNQCEDKKSIEKLSIINKLTNEAVDELKARENELIAENKELLKDYKELVVHTSFNDQHNKPTDKIGGGVVSFEESLANFMNKK